MEEIPDWIAIVLLVFFVCMCAFYSATETAFACLNRYKFEVEADEGKKSSSLIVRLYEHFETTLISVLIGNNVFAVLVSTFSTFLFYRWFSALMADGTLDASIVSLIASISMSLIVFLFGDTIPKFIAKKMPEKVARLTVYPMTFFIILFYPFSLIFRGINFVAKKMFRAKEELPITNEDIASEIEKMEEVGELEENESDIIVNSLDFAETSVKEVLTPRTRMSMIDANGLTKEKLLEYLKTCPYSRIPFYFKEKDKIIGVLVVKNFLAAYFHDNSVGFLPYLQKAYFVTPAVKIDDLLDGFREHHTQVAIVRKGEKVIGMVTTEDVLEELVGTIKESNQASKEARQ